MESAKAARVTMGKRENEKLRDTERQRHPERFRDL